MLCKSKKTLGHILIPVILCLKLECSCYNEILEADSDDPLLIVDGKDAEEESRLPNSHSAAFVMAFIFLCVLAYGAYRACRCKCMHRKQPLTVDLDAPSELGTKGLESYVKEHEEYLAIFGPKNEATNLHVCEFKKDMRESVSTPVS